MYEIPGYDEWLESQMEADFARKYEDDEFNEDEEYIYLHEEDVIDE